MEPKDICRRFDEVERRRGNFPQLWQEVIDYIIPNATPVTSASIAGEQRAQKLYDGTADLFMDRLASTIVGLLMSQSERWFGLRPGGVENEELETWLDASADKLYDALHASNFYAEAPESIFDILAMGTNCLFVDERPLRKPGFNGFVFRNIAIAEFFIDENDQGEVDTWFRRIEFTPRQAAQKFGKDKLHENVRRMLEDEGATEPVEVLHAVHRRDDPAFAHLKRFGDRSKAGMPWVSVYVDKKNEHIIDIGGFRDQRYFSPRWSKRSSEVYGRGPAIKCLPDAKTLNTMVRYGLEGAALQVYPPWLFPEESIIGRLRLTPGARNVYDPQPNGEIKPLIGGGNFAAEQAKEEALRQQIARRFMDDVLGLREEGEITATEVLDRRERRQQVTGPAVSRLITEFLDPLVSTCWKMMFRAGAFGRPPQALGQAESLDVEFISPLGRAQKLGTVRALQDVMAILGPLAQSIPGMLDHYDFDAIAREVPADFGVPRKWLIDERRVAQTRAGRAQAQQRQAALVQGAELAKVAAEVGQAEA